MSAAAGLTWHQALAYALTGRRLPELGRQPAPDLPALTAWLRAEGLGTDSRPGDVPADLMEGLGPAQFWAACTRLRTDLQTGPAAAPVLVDRPLTAEERRLLADVPPHHGS